MGWVNLVARFLMLGPWALGAIAAACFGLGYYLQLSQNQKFAENAQILAAGMPAVVDIEDFDRARDRNGSGEVHLRAQLLLESSYELTLQENIGTDYAYMVPLFDTDAVAAELIGVAIWTSSDFDFDEMTLGRLLAKTDHVGTLGPVTRINGYNGGLGKWDEIVRDALRDEGLALPSSPVVVFPYIGGRHANLPTSAEDTMTMFGLFSKIGGAIGLLALLKLVFSGGPGRTEEEAEPETAPAPVSAGTFFDDAPAPAMAATAPDMSQQPTRDPGLPLWKQRLMEKQAAEGLLPEDPAPVPVENVDADDDWAPKPSYNVIAADAGAPMRRISVGRSDQAPVMGDPKPLGDIISDDPLVDTPRNRGGMLRKALIGVVGVAFALVLVAVLGSLISEASQNETATVVDPNVALAEAMAEQFLPSNADPDRHISEIDATPIARWLLKTFFLATMGDTTAIIILMSIIGTVLMSGFILRYYFFVRGAIPRNRLAVDFSDMGIN